MGLQCSPVEQSGLFMEDEAKESVVSSIKQVQRTACLSG